MQFCSGIAYGHDDTRHCAGWPLGRLLAFLAVTTAAGCAPVQPTPERPDAQIQRVQPVVAARPPPKHLMTAPREPSCVASTGGPRPPAVKSPVAPGSPPAPKSGPPDDSLAANVRVEFERDCYRAAEQRARRQLQQLQAAIKAGGRPAPN